MCDIVDDDCAVGVAIVHWRKRFVSLLACGIPYLQLHALAVELNGADLEVDADGGDE